MTSSSPAPKKPTGQSKTRLPSLTTTSATTSLLGEPRPVLFQACVLLAVSCGLFLGSIAALGAGLRGEVLPPIRPQLLFLGDALTELGENVTAGGWVTHVRNNYVRSADIIVRGFSGYNTKWCLTHVIPVVEYDVETWLSPELITIWFGLNDAALPDGPDKVQHVPLDNYRANLLKIVQGLQAKAPNAKILFITPPHVDDSRRNKDRSNASAGQYARACVETGKQAGVPTLDLYSFFNAMPADKRNGYLIDGLHFNADGNHIVDEQIRAAIREHFPDLVPILEKWQLPNCHDYSNRI